MSFQLRSDICLDACTAFLYGAAIGVRPRRHSGPCQGRRRRLSTLHRLRIIASPGAIACSGESRKGPSFRARKADLTYSVYVRVPSDRNLCVERPRGARGTLHLNKISSRIPGLRRVTWFVEGKRIGDLPQGAESLIWSPPPCPVIH